MSIRDKLKKYMYNPELSQKIVLDTIEQVNNGENVITSVNNPFNLLLEATATVSSNAALESINHLRSLYPDLATSINDLTKHLSDDEIDGMVSKPGDCIFTFFINLTDLLSNGYRPDKANYVEMTIPEKTQIKVQDITFTLLNDILIKYYDNDIVLVEHIQNDNVNSVKDQGVLKSGLTTTSDGHRLIVFGVKIKQLKITRYTFTPTIAQGFNKTLNITQDNKFYHLDIWYRNAKTRNKDIKLNVKYNEEYINPSVPTAYIRFDNNDLNKGLMDLNKIGVFIPDIYFLEHGVSGTITVDLYETLGGVNIPLNKISMKEFKLELGEIGKNQSTSVSTSITMFVMSNGVLNNGSSGLNFEEMKESIIKNARGGQSIPITQYQLESDGKKDGFEIFKMTDTLTERTYIACKNLNKKPEKYIKALQDVYFNTVSIELDKYIKHDFVSIYEDSFIIKSGAVFKEKNSVVNMLNQDELNELDMLSNLQKIEFYKRYKYLYTPFYYIISRQDRISTSRVYSFDRPVLKNLRINAINQNIKYKANTDHYIIEKVEDGYEISIKLIKNEDLKNISEEHFKMTIAIPLVTSNKLFINGEYDKGSDLFKFKIESDMYADKDDRLKLNNGYATTNVNFSNLENTIETYIYTTDPSVVDEYRFLADSIYGVNEDYVVLTHELIDLTFGKRIKYIWDKMYIDYTERRYKKYQEDVYAYYEKDIYDQDPFTGFEFTYFKDEKESGIEYLLKHKKGDPVLDDEGNHLILHHKGDIILQDNGLPMIDDFGGMIRNIDICMLEYEFKLTEDDIYKSYNSIVMSELEEYLFRLVPEKNVKLLEHTSLFYKSYKTASPLIAKINGSYYAIPSSVSPTIKILYNTGEETKLTSQDIENIETVVGGVIDEYFENEYIKLEELRTKIKEAIGSYAQAVQITGIDPSNSEMLIFKDKTKRLSLKKKLELTEWNQIIVKYDIVVNIEVI